MNLFMHMSLAQLIAAIGGTTIFAYILILIFAPSVLTIATPIITNLVKGIAAFIRYLWGAFLFTSQSVPAMALLVCVAIFFLGVGHYRGTVKTWAKVHKEYTLTKKKLKNDDGPTYNIFRHPLEAFR